MIKKVLLSLAVAAAIILVLLAATRPTDEDYEKWLAEEQGITCANDGVSIFRCNWVKDGQEQTIEWASKAATTTPIYQRIRDTYEDDAGNLIEVRAFGMLKTFIEY